MREALRRLRRAARQALAGARRRSARCYAGHAPRRAECPEHGVKAGAVPWERSASSRFTSSFEDQVAWLALHMCRSALTRAHEGGLARRGRDMRPRGGLARGGRRAGPVRRAALDLYLVK